MEIKGIDVSNAQGVIDWDRVKNEVGFVIIRCGWGGDYTKQDDPKFKEYRQACIDRDIPYGVYLYSYALNTDSAKSEAAHTIRLLDGLVPPLGVWYDMEDADHYKQKHGINVYNSRQLLTDFCKIYCDALISAGYDCGVYANYDYWKNVLIKDQLSKYPIWLAIWGVTKPPMECKIWQYTSGGSVPGIVGNVDMDVLYTDEPIPEPTPQDRTITGMPTLQRGSEGKSVAVWQTIVKAFPDGIFDEITEDLTKRFQKEQNITVDGIVGSETWNAGINSL
jgi:GH25 family lysozyme M1 (1,4-beta-N-acetylmuramidase)